jgi:HSP20 family protein
MPLDVTENEESFVIKAALPGVDPEDVEITLNDNVLTIRGETSQEHEHEQANRYHLREHRYGSFMRSIALPSSIERENVQASCENGILRIQLPKSAAAKPRRISINPGKTIEGQSTGSTQQAGTTPGPDQSGAKEGRGQTSARTSNSQPDNATPNQQTSATLVAGGGMEGREG